MKLLVTGGAGFIGSHIAEYYAKSGDEVRVIDNLSRQKLLKKEVSNASYNWNYLTQFDNIEFFNGDIRDARLLRQLTDDVEVIIHTAGQTAVTSSMADPRTDFEINALGTLNLLESARLGNKKPCVIFCSTNKVYGDNVNSIPVSESDLRYSFKDRKYRSGIPETFSIDQCEHTPYGCSKLAADLYIQDYAIRKEIKAGIFRMSCIYGPRQFGVEDQGWVAWFCIATMMGYPINIFGDGKQVRDVLFISDLINAFNSFIKKKEKIEWGVYNLGGGPDFTLSLIELVDLLTELTDKKSQIIFDKWRPSDQKVYISDISKAKKELGWEPIISPKAGIQNIISWIKDNNELFRV
jgi:CDP-paratose 2-epimerase